MAILNNPPNGNISGSCGDLVYRTVGKRTIICTKPGKRKKSENPEVIARCDKFGLANKLFGAVGRVTWFKRIWTSSRIKGSNYINKMFTYSFKKIGGEYDIDNLPLLPIDSGFEVLQHSIERDGHKLILTAEISSEQTGIKSQYIPEISAQGIIYFNSPIDPTDNKMEVCSVVSGNVQLKTDSFMTFELDVNSAEASFFESYNYNRIILNLMIKNIEGEPQNASVNLCYTV